MNLHVPDHAVRFITPPGLFDGHDAAINVTRRRPRPDMYGEVGDQHRRNV